MEDDRHLGGTPRRKPGMIAVGNNFYDGRGFTATMDLWMGLGWLLDSSSEPAPQQNRH